MDYSDLIKLQQEHKVSVIANAVALFAATLNITQLLSVPYIDKYSIYVSLKKTIGSEYLLKL